MRMDGKSTSKYCFDDAQSIYLTVDVSLQQPIKANNWNWTRFECYCQNGNSQTPDGYFAGEIYENGSCRMGKLKTMKWHYEFVLV